MGRWGGGGGGRGGNFAARTASHAGVLPHQRSYSRCLRAMVKPSVYDEPRLRRRRVSKVARPNGQ